jgi:predicted metal-dependent phosphoesterase TrpH
MTPDDLVVAAKAAGLDAVCITEHDALWPRQAIEDLAEKHAFPVLRGIEVTTEVGHVLVYGVSAWRRGLSTVKALHDFVRSEDGVMFLAHPSRRYGRPAGQGMLGGIFDSLETENASEGAVQNSTAAALARGLRLPGIGGSDAHSAREVGASATRLARPVRSERELVEELRRGLHVAVSRSPLGREP